MTSASIPFIDSISKPTAWAFSSFHSSSALFSSASLSATIFAVSFTKFNGL